jgi:hypothetical protein
VTPALDSIATVLDRLQVPWVLIGALAANRYRNSPRLTQDVDVLIDAPGARLAELETALRSIIHKLIAGRFQDAADIEAILAAHPALDEAYVERWVQFWEVTDAWQRLSAVE